jgi:uncharacterized protein YndB with AHSA1/START domain
MISLDKDKEIINTRIFNLPYEVVFDAWANPELLAQWWGPKGFTNTFHEFDFRPGGTWKFTMHSPDGQGFVNTCIFEEIIKPERIVFKHLLPVHIFWLTATFEKVNGSTKLTFRQLFETAEECNHIKEFVIQANEQNLDRLETVIYNNLNKK